MIPGVNVAMFMCALKRAFKRINARLCNIQLVVSGKKGDDMIMRRTRRVCLCERVQ